MSSFELGLMARPFKEQFPKLTDHQAHQYDEDNKALMRLRMRGYLTDSARDVVVKKIGKDLETTLKGQQHDK